MLTMNKKLSFEFFIPVEQKNVINVLEKQVQKEY